MTSVLLNTVVYDKQAAITVPFLQKKRVKFWSIFFLISEMAPEIKQMCSILSLCLTLISNRKEYKYPHTMCGINFL